MNEIKMAKDIIKDIENKGQISVPEGCVTGEAFEKWLYEDNDKIIKALAACSEFECCNCPYQYLDDEEYPLRCIHALIKDTYGMLEEVYVKSIKSRNNSTSYL